MDDIALKKQEQVSVPEYGNILAEYNNALTIVDDIVLKKYVGNLNKLEIVPLEDSLIENNIQDNIRIFKINEMVYEKDEFSTYKFASVFNTIANLNCSVFLILNSDEKKTNFYMGIRIADDMHEASYVEQAVENALKGQFPGTKTEKCDYEAINELIKKIKIKNISSVSCVANPRENITSDNNFVQGIEKLVLSMQGQKYTAIIIADSTSHEQMNEIRKGYETVYTQLTPFSKRQINYGNSNSISYSRSESKGSSVGHSDTEGTSDSRSETVSKSESSSHSVSSENAAGKAMKGVAAAVNLVGVALAVPSGGMSLTAGALVGGTLGAMVNNIGGIVSKTNSSSNSESTTNSYSDTHSVNHSSTESVSENESRSKTQGISGGTSNGITITADNKIVSDILSRIDRQIKRMDEFESLGMYQCAAYFMAEDTSTAEIAASTYKALMSGTNTGVEISAINSWLENPDKKRVEMLGKYVTNFIHPVFKYSGAMGNIEVTPCSFVSGNELALHMGLPRHSVSGLPVINHADFGKEVVKYSDMSKSGNTINLGKIFNMGSVYSNSISLDVESLSMHTFITGSTGSGKSNTIYEMLGHLLEKGINFMVIEPAKGEYKNVFGGRKNVFVYGTNPNYTPLIKINPFRFAKGIHVYEHIDRLIEIFNVCWPMYAAMPAVLKEAVLKAYEDCGWDLTLSQNPKGDIYPNFKDLLDELTYVIRNSAYSEEVKSNYMGSLVTRVKSLTNGLNGQIFTSDEIDNQTLFDKNVIIDLSRVGSAETKSLIMGILIMRLGEYRMSDASTMNSPLRHITVLEEAHNILKKTSTDQDPENPSIGGKSVELLSNAIAEMRTYGEGFIIADQSPSAVDVSAIRNTNTKIIMRLPDEIDRRSAGKAAALNDAQIDEIAKLPKGVAVIYQNDWVDPVLCRINKFSEKEMPYQHIRTTGKNVDEKKFKTEVLKLLLKDRCVEAEEADTDFIINNINRVDISEALKSKLKDIIYENNIDIFEDEKFGELSSLVAGIMSAQPGIKETADNAESIEYIHGIFSNMILNNTENISDELRILTIQCFMRDMVTNSPENKVLYSDWREKFKEGRLF